MQLFILVCDLAMLPVPAENVARAPGEPSRSNVVGCAWFGKSAGFASGHDSPVDEHETSSRDSQAARE